MELTRFEKKVISQFILFRLLWSVCVYHNHSKCDESSENILTQSENLRAIIGGYRIRTVIQKKKISNSIVSTERAHFVAKGNQFLENPLKDIVFQ